MRQKSCVLAQSCLSLFEGFVFKLIDSLFAQQLTSLFVQHPLHCRHMNYVGITNQYTTTTMPPRVAARTGAAAAAAEAKEVANILESLLDQNSNVHRLIHAAIQFYANKDNSMSERLKTIFSEFTQNIPNSILFREGQHASRVSSRARSTWKYDRFLSKLVNKIETTLQDPIDEHVAAFKKSGDAELFLNRVRAASSQASKDIQARFGTFLVCLVLLCCLFRDLAVRSCVPGVAWPIRTCLSVRLFPQTYFSLRTPPRTASLLPKAHRLRSSACSRLSRCTTMPRRRRSTRALTLTTPLRRLASNSDASSRVHANASPP